MTDAPQSLYPVSATDALIAKWRAEARRHGAAAKEPDMDAQEYTLHDECYRVYSKCADELASIGAAQAPAYPDIEAVPMDRVIERAIRAFCRKSPGFPDLSLTAMAKDIADAVSRAMPSVAQAANVLSEEERRAVEHARYQVGQASMVQPDCCFDYDLVKDLLRAIDRAYPLPSTDPRCTCAAIVNPNIPHARSCPLSSTNETGAA